MIPDATHPVVLYLTIYLGRVLECSSIADGGVFFLSEICLRERRNLFGRRYSCLRSYSSDTISRLCGSVFNPESRGLVELNIPSSRNLDMRPGRPDSLWCDPLVHKVNSRRTSSSVGGVVRSVRGMNGAITPIRP